VAFCAPKGGTGRTTLAINTAIALHKFSNDPVVLIDADYAAPAVDVALNLVAHKNIADLLPRLSRLDADLVASILASHASGIQVLLAPPPADLSSPITLPQVQQVLAWLKRMFPWVIVDLGLPLDDTAFAFLDGADRIVMSVLPEMVGLRNTRLMLEQLVARGYPKEKVWLVLNRATMRGGVPVADIEERLHVPVRYRIPDDQPLATHTINRGVPLVMSHSSSALARSVLGFATELQRDVAAQGTAGAQPAPAAASGPLSRLLGRLARGRGGAA
jgi:pilus assembly protein CpaE